MKPGLNKDVMFQKLALSNKVKSVLSLRTSNIVSDYITTSVTLITTESVQEYHFFTCAYKHGKV